jgi:hypothetical protein
MLAAARGAFDAWRREAAVWCTGRMWAPRAVVLAYIAYAGVRHLADPLYRSWFGGVTLVFHEMGHIVFGFAGQTLQILGGSLMQLLVPAAAALYLRLAQKDRFGAAVCLAWLAFSTWELSAYIADASREELPLVGLGGKPEHDWSLLLTKWHLLNHDQDIAKAARVVAALLWGASTLYAGTLCYWMWKNRARASTSPGRPGR